MNETRQMDAGRIPEDWLDNARVNEGSDETVELWFARVSNAENVEITPDRCVAVDGRWLDQESIDDACRHIDAGV